MRSLLFLFGRTAKNRVLSLVRKPGRLVPYLILAAWVVWSIVTALAQQGTAHAATGDYLDIGWLKLAFLAYILLFAITGISSGLSTGASLFEMADVNLLFISPVNPKQILVYALGRLTLRTLFASFFILMMGPMLQSSWGLSPGALAPLFAGYVLALLIFQLATVCIYMYTNQRPAAKRGVVVVALLLLLPAVIAVLVPIFGGAAPAQALLDALNGNILFSLPIAGWIVQGVFAVLAGNTVAALIAAALLLAAIALFLILMTVGKSDYYEDVLVAAETQYQRRQATLGGNVNTAETTRRVRARPAGENRPIWGWGASAFLGKHLREVFRKNRLKLLDASSFSYIVATVIVAFLTRSDSEGLGMVFAVVMGMRVMLVGTGLGLKELYSHIIFMVPASSFSKLVWSNLEVCVKALAENILVFIIGGIIVRAAVPEIIMCILCATVFVALLVAVNLLSMRMFASIASQGLLITLYFLFIVLVMAPGIAALVIVMVLVPGGAGFPLGLLALALWQALMAALFIFLSRGVLDTCDMETMQGPKG